MLRFHTNQNDFDFISPISLYGNSNTRFYEVGVETEAEYETIVKNGSRVVAYLNYSRLQFGFHLFRIGVPALQRKGNIVRELRSESHTITVFRSNNKRKQNWLIKINGVNTAGMRLKYSMLGAISGIRFFCTVKPRFNLNYPELPVVLWSILVHEIHQENKW